MEFKWFKWEEGMPIEHAMVTKSIETAQRRVEGHNFDIRKQLIEYDNIMNRQREVIYEQRRRILEGVDLHGMVRDIIGEAADTLVDTYAARELRPDAWDLDGLRSAVTHQFGVTLSGELSTDREAMVSALADTLEQAYDAKRQTIGAELMGQLERTVLLSIMDAKWKDHLYMMDALRDGIGLRAYGQRDPVVEYQREAYRMFQEMTAAIKIDAVTMLLRVQPVAEPRPVSVFATTPQQAIHPAAPTLKTTAALGSRLEAEGQATPPPLERALPGALSFPAGLFSR